MKLKFKKWFKKEKKTKNIWKKNKAKKKQK